MKRWLALLVAGLLWAPSLSAHPTAISSVVIRIVGEGVVRVEVTTDEKSLKLKLRAMEAVGGRAGGLEDFSHLRADGALVPLTIEKVEPVADRVGLVRYRLAGALTSGTSAITWDTPLFLGTYPLAFLAGDAPLTDAPEDYEWIDGPARSREYDPSAVTVATSGWATFLRLIAVGVAHIVPGGIDHVLFVLGVFLFAVNVRSLVLQISAFTLAHSLTLALAMTGLVRVPAAIVEPLIALSIAYIAIENMTSSTLSKRRLAVVFAFGLLHGLGFASALAELGVARTHLVATLIGFNVGVEIGQLAVVGLAAAGVWLLGLSEAQQRTWVRRPASLAIAAAGICWAVERL